MSTYLDYFSANRERFIKEWTEFLSFKSISADPAYHDECVSCANWLSEHLQGLGFRTEVWPTETLPLVFGEIPGNPNKPTVLFYGHYDVQPVDPLNLWSSPPFEPTIRDGRMYARGAQDNKGQVFYWMKAIEALGAAGADLPTIKVLIEGEEESGSEAINQGLDGWADRLKADVLMVCDTGVIQPSQPTITMGLRGTAHFELQVHGPKYDLHSGVYGGVVLNPLQALTSIVASLYNKDGSVAVPGFYDHVKPVSDEDKKLANSAPINVGDMQEMLGVSLAGGERGVPVMERRGFRPTLELNGIGGGYQGAGGKTVIPSHAFAKFSMRLVKGQEPQETFDIVVRHLEQMRVEGVRIEVHDKVVSGPALSISSLSPVIKKAREAIVKAFGQEPVYLWEGASIPIVAKLAVVSGADPLLVGFGEEGDKIHAPDESFSLRQLQEGFRYVTSFFSVV
jgi:acetylornithine deacetylase/succinyl-diaminopimelate desuccinylase-like protein